MTIIEAILLTLTRRGTPALAAAIAISYIGVGATPARAQSTRQKFDVASIHPCSRGTIPPLREGGGLGIMGPSPNRVAKTCVTVLTLIQDAYIIFADGQNRSGSSIQMPPIEKAPAWISSDL